MKISRRDMLLTIAAGATSTLAIGKRATGQVQRGKVKVAAIQMAYTSGDFLVNLTKAANMVRAAAQKGAKWVLLPEYFASGLGWGAEFVDAALPIDGLPTKLLRRLARESNIGVAGTIVTQQKEDSFNTCILAEPSGQLHFHDKDDPTGPIEAAHWIAGKDDGVFKTADGPMGAAICWEAIRTRTAERLLKAGVALVFAPGGWGKAKGDDKDTHQSLFRDAHTKLARMVGAPVIVSNPCGFSQTIVRDWSPNASVVPNQEFVNKEQFAVSWLGGSKIVDAQGQVLASRPPEEGEGIVLADVELGSVNPVDPIPNRFWIPKEMPEFWLKRFEEHRPKGRELYRKLIRPSRNNIRLPG